MKRVSLAQASGSLAKYATELDEDIVVVTRGRRPLAALVPLKNVDRESLALSMSPELLGIVRGARAEFAAGRSLSLKEMRRRIVPDEKTATTARPRAESSRHGRKR